MLAPCASLLSNGIYTGIVSSIGTMTMGIYNTIKSIYSHQNPDVIKQIKTLDIEYKLRLIDSILQNQNLLPIKTTKEHINNQSVIFTTVDKSVSNLSRSCTPLEINLVYLSKSIKDIHQILTQINQKILYHQTKWFGPWRALHVTGLMTDLGIHNLILQNRLDDFMKIFHTYK